MSVPKRKLKKLKRELKRGSLAKIARELNLSPAYVTQVMNGEYPNDKVIARAIELKSEQDKAKAELNDNLDKAIGDEPKP